MSMDDILCALMKASRADLKNIRLYIEWMKIRRRVNHHFYFSAHWVRGSGKYHWVE